MKYAVALAFLAVGVCSGCSTPEQDARHAQQEIAYCQSIGFSTPAEIGGCRLQMQNIQAQREMANSAFWNDIQTLMVPR